MKSVREDVKPIKFPCLMISTDRGDEIVLFTKPKVGTVVQIEQGSSNWVGEYCDYWNMDYFLFCKGRVILSNEDV